MRFIIAPIFCIFFLLCCNAQETKYVNADNGLLVRVSPDKKAKRIGKLTYGSKIYITERTGISLRIMDDGKEINGEWVGIHHVNTNTKGFVFDGYLSTNKLPPRLQLLFSNFQVQIALDGWTENEPATFVKTDTINVFVELGDSPQGKQVAITHSAFKKVELFQRYENSVTIMNEGPHCDLTEWKHYVSPWKKLDVKKDSFTAILENYTQEQQSTFIEVDSSELQLAVQNYCGENWYKLIEKVKSIQEYLSGVSLSRILLKIIATDKNDKVTEKVIVFNIPMGC